MCKRKLHFKIFYDGSINRVWRLTRCEISGEKEKSQYVFVYGTIIYMKKRNWIRKSILIKTADVNFKMIKDFKVNHSSKWKL